MKLKISLLLVLFLGAGRLEGVEPGAARPRDVAVLSPEGGEVVLTVRVHEASYGPDAVFEVERLRQAPPAGTGSGDVALAYLAAVLRGSPAPSSFYELGEVSPEKADQAAEIYRKILAGLPGGAQRLRLERVWLFRDFQVHLVRALSPSGKSALLSVSTKKTGGGIRRSDEWGEWQPVHNLFWYMVRNADRGLERAAAGPLPVTFTLGAGGEGPPLAVSLDGTRYGAAKTWLRVAPVQAPATPGDFVLNALAVAAGGSDEGLLALWHGPEREKLARSRTGPAAIAAVRRNLAGIQAVRHLFTAAAGDHRVHYFLDERRPQEVCSLVLTSEAGRLWLSRSLYGNLEIFFTSPLVERAVYQTFGE